MFSSVCVSSAMPFYVVTLKILACCCQFKRLTIPQHHLSDTYNRNIPHFNRQWKYVSRKKYHLSSEVSQHKMKNYNKDSLSGPVFSGLSINVNTRRTYSSSKIPRKSGALIILWKCVLFCTEHAERFVTFTKSSKWVMPETHFFIFSSMFWHVPGNCNSFDRVRDVINKLSIAFFHSSI